VSRSVRLCLGSFSLGLSLASGLWKIDSFSFAVPLEPALGKAHWLMRQKVEKAEVSPLFPLFFHAYTTLLA